MFEEAGATAITKYPAPDPALKVHGAQPLRRRWHWNGLEGFFKHGNENMTARRAKGATPGERHGHKPLELVQVQFITARTRGNSCGSRLLRGIVAVGGGLRGGGGFHDRLAVLVQRQTHQP